VIPHGVDTNVFYKVGEDQRIAVKKLRLKYGVLDDEVLLVNVGALTPNKGVGILLRALFELIRLDADRFNKVKLFLKGPPESLYSTASSFQEEIRSVPHADLLMRKHVIVVNEVLSPERLNLLYNAADAYISPYYYEGFNLPVLEAIAAGLPVFVTKNGCTDFYISHILSEVPGSDAYLFTFPLVVDKNLINRPDVISHNVKQIVGVLQDQLGELR
jgi:glycosyltransferase involved in cell wall biosynthesis